MEKRAVILCGGIGSRLRPYTITIPKPLMPLGDVSILEVILTQLKKHQFSHVTLSVNYRAELIRAYLQDGEKFGLKIDYSEETKPLSTVGPLTLITDLPEKFLVLNGDVLTDLDFGKLLSEHDHNQAQATISLSKRIHQIDFGVFEFDQKDQFTNFLEKPEHSYLVSMGVYCFSRTILQSVPQNTTFGFDDLMHHALDKDLKLRFHHHDGFWLDIGRHEDYAKAQDEWPRLRSELGIAA